MLSNVLSVSPVRHGRLLPRQKVDRTRQDTTPRAARFQSHYPFWRFQILSPLRQWPRSQPPTGGDTEPGLPEAFPWAWRSCSIPLPAHPPSPAEAAATTEVRTACFLQFAGAGAEGDARRSRGGGIESGYMVRSGALRGLGREQASERARRGI
jgi:hypothetical protein